MTVSDRSKRLALFIAFGSVAVLGIALSFFVFGILSHQWDQPWARSLAGFLQIPAARVGGTVVPYDQYLVQIDAERQFLSGPVAKAQNIPNEITPEIKKAALERTMRMIAIEEMATSKEIFVTPLDADRAYDQLVLEAGTSTTPDEIRAFLRDQFGWDESSFKKYVVRPALLEDLVRERMLKENPDPEAVDKMLAERLQRPDVKRYLDL